MSASASGARRVGYVRIVIDELCLLLDWADVRSVEFSSDLMNVAVDAASLDGSQTQPGDGYGDSPLVVLDANLHARRGDCAAYRACVLVDAGRVPFGILCDQVDVVRAAEVRLHPVPTCIADGRLPVAAMAQIGERIGFVAHARRLGMIATRASL